ncbi:MAG: methyltransferase domain-containing protein [Gemmataceae bacterium]|nr:methyltransferase domain-containing protein [Gemmataceae bacterium]MDW8264712.1 methyltransferase domain-containing protein [Gemmataceae bacterium]
MNRIRTLILGTFAGLAVLSLGSAAQGQLMPAVEAKPVALKVTIDPDAELIIEGKVTVSRGEVRHFISPPVPLGRNYYYTVKVIIKEEGKPDIVVDRQFSVRPGEENVVDLRVPGRTVAKVEEKPKTEDKTKVEEKPKTEDQPKLTVPFVPTPQEVVEKMLELAEVTKDDVVYDLGCGDGRIVVTAAKKYGAKAVGVDLDPKRVEESLKNVKEAGVEQLVEIRKGDVLKTDVSPATVVTLYLLPSVNRELKPILQKSLKPGSRIVSHDFDMGEDWKPLKKVNVTDNDGTEHTLYLWKIEDKDAKKEENKPEKEPDVIYVPTPQEVVEKMLELAEVTKNDVVYDLGCGDGRIVVTAAKKYGARAVGFDVDPERIKESLENVKKAGVENLVTIKKEDIFTQDLSGATVVTLYLLPELNVKLIPQLEKLKPGSRIVSHDFDMKGMKPKKVVKFTPPGEGQREHVLYLWIIPFEKEEGQ